MVARRWQPAETPTNRLQLRRSIQIPPLAMTASLHPEAKPRPAPHAPHHFYGTRLSTVLLVAKDGRVRFVERDVWTLASNHHHNNNNTLPAVDKDRDRTANEGANENEENEDENENEEDEVVIRGDPRAQREHSFYLAGKSSE